VTAVLPPTTSTTKPLILPSEKTSAVKETKADGGEHVRAEGGGADVGGGVDNRRILTRVLEVVAPPKIALTFCLFVVMAGEELITSTGPTLNPPPSVRLNELTP